MNNDAQARYRLWNKLPIGPIHVEDWRACEYCEARTVITIASYDSVREVFCLTCESDYWE